MNFADVTKEAAFYKRLQALKVKRGYATEHDCILACVRLGMFFMAAPVGAVITRSASGMTGFEPPSQNTTKIEFVWPKDKNDEPVF